MIGEFTNHVWQSTLFAVAVGLLAATLRKNRAQVRYGLWVAASLKFFLPFSLLIDAGSGLAWAPAAQHLTATMTTPEISTRILQISQPYPAVLSRATSQAAQSNWLQSMVVAIWACGFLVVAAMRLRDGLRLREALRSSTPLVDERHPGVDVRSAPGVFEPGVVGWLRPVLLLPGGIEEKLSRPQFDAVIAHEICHVRRRDNVVSALHMILEAVFWFVPRVWWIGAQLVEEREFACDEAVLEAGFDPQVYAEAILNVCKLYVSSPLACVAGITGANIKRRIEAMMNDRVPRRVSPRKKLALTLAGLTAFATPILVGILGTPSLPAQSRAVPPATRPKFEVASIRPCGSGNFNGDAGGGKKGGGGGKGGGSSPGRLMLSCMSLVDEDGILGLIHRAYDRYADGEDRPWAMLPISGGPAWIKSEEYDINAKASGTPTMEMMNGPMLQTLLEDRFKLKVHHESREMPVYQLVGSKSGSKLQPFQEGSCLVVDWNKVPPPTLAPGQKACGGGVGGRRGPNILLDATRTSVEELAKLLSLVLDRPVVDKTGIPGLFDFHLAFGIDQTTPRYLPGGDQADMPAIPSDEGPAPSIFTEVQQKLGLKLEPAKGSREYIVIDHVEKPSEN